MSSSTAPLGIGRGDRPLLPRDPGNPGARRRGRRRAEGDRSVGPDQTLVFRESDEQLPPFDGHHVQIYLADFSGPYRRLLERGLISQEDDQHQYRFIDIVDLESNRPLFAIEHEVRSMRHPLYARPLVNRNPSQTNRHYMPDHDTWRGPFIPD